MFGVVTRNFQSVNTIFSGEAHSQQVVQRFLVWLESNRCERIWWPLRRLRLFLVLLLDCFRGLFLVLLRETFIRVSDVAIVFSWEHMVKRAFYVISEMEKDTWSSFTIEAHFDQLLYSVLVENYTFALNFSLGLVKPLMERVCPLTDHF